MLYGGAAGGGKSFFLRWWAVFYLLALLDAGIKGATVGLFCEDYPSLLDRQISKIRTEFPASLGELKEGVTRDFQLRREYGGGRILLRNLDDPAKYLSAEFAGIAVDELTRNDMGTFDFLRLRLRWPGVVRPRFVGASNPSGRGHGWVKKLWVDGELPAHMRSLANEFRFIPAKASDNPYLNEQYHKDLEALPPAMAKAYAEGSWDLFAGQYFDMPISGCIERPETWNIEKWRKPRWISIDWGFRHPSAVYWNCLSEQKQTRTYREYVHNQLDPEELGREIVARTAEDGERSAVANVYLSPDAWAQRDSSRTNAERLGDALTAGGLPRPQAADDDRVGGWRLMYEMLRSGQWKIGANCQALIRTLPTLVYDEKQTEDCAKMDDPLYGSGMIIDASNASGDDMADAIRYGLKSYHSPGKKPLEVRIQERVATFAASIDSEVEDLDPNQVAWLSRKAELIERKPHRVTRRWRPGMRRN